MPDSKVPWLELIAGYSIIRDLIEKTIPGFDNYNARIAVPGGFRIPPPPTKRQWPTPTGKAMFSVCSGVHEDTQAQEDDILRLMTLRSYGQYKTPLSMRWMTATEACLGDAIFCL